MRIYKGKGLYLLCVFAVFNIIAYSCVSFECNGQSEIWQGTSMIVSKVQWKRTSSKRDLQVPCLSTGCSINLVEKGCHSNSMYVHKEISNASRSFCFLCPNQLQEPNAPYGDAKLTFSGIAVCGRDSSSPPAFVTQWSALTMVLKSPAETWFNRAPGLWCHARCSCARWVPSIG